MKKILVVSFLFIVVVSSAFSYSLGNGLVSFDIPKELEIQNQSASSIVDTYTQLISGESINTIDSITLQQKGLNNLESDAFDKYCRIKVSISVEESQAGITNKMIEEEFNSYSESEKKEFLDIFKEGIAYGTVVKEWKDTSIKKIGNLSAFRISFIRESTVGKGDVYVDSYLIFSDIYVVQIICSYRVSEKDYFESSIEQFLKSIKFDSLLSDPSFYTLPSVQLYKATLPWVSKTFQWPESNIKWKDSNDIDGYIKSTEWSNIYLTCNLQCMNLKQRATGYSKQASLLNLQSITQGQITRLFKTYSGKLLENKNSDNTLRISYSYSVEGININGKIYYKFIDDYRLIAISFEYLDVYEKTVNNILSSLGF